MDSCQTIKSAIPNCSWAFFFPSYPDTNSEGDFSFNFCSCLVIFGQPKPYVPFNSESRLGSVMPVKTCQFSSHSCSQPRSRRNVCSWMLLLPQIAFVSGVENSPHAACLGCDVVLTPERLSPFKVITAYYILSASRAVLIIWRELAFHINRHTNHSLHKLP